MAEPATLTIAKVLDVFLASFNANLESNVSPDCEMKMTHVSLSQVFALYLNSDAITTSHGILARDSIKYFPVIDA